MITENLSTLKIHKLSKAQYNRELEAGRIDENALYLTPDEEIDVYSKNEIDDKLSNKLDVPSTTTEIPVSDYGFSYTLTSPNEKIIISQTSEDSDVPYNIVILIGDDEYECFHSDVTSHTLPDDLYLTEHWTNGSNKTTEAEVKNIWKSGAVVQAKYGVFGATVQSDSSYATEEYVNNKFSNVHTLDITYTDGTTSTIKIVGVE